MVKIEFDDYSYRLSARALEIKLLYEKVENFDRKGSDIERVDNRIAAFETYLTRNDMEDIDKLGYRNFVKIVKKLLKLKSISNKDLEEKHSIAEREWILEKVEQRTQWKKKIPFRT